MEWVLESHYEESKRLRYADDTEALKKVVAARPESDYNVSDETYQMIAMLTNSEDLLLNKEVCESDENIALAAN